MMARFMGNLVGYGVASLLAALVVLVSNTNTANAAPVDWIGADSISTITTSLGPQRAYYGNDFECTFRSVKTFVDPLVGAKPGYGCVMDGKYFSTMVGPNSGTHVSFAGSDVFYPLFNATIRPIHGTDTAVVGSTIIYDAASQIVFNRARYIYEFHPNPDSRHNNPLSDVVSVSNNGKYVVGRKHDSVPSLFYYTHSLFKTDVATTDTIKAEEIRSLFDPEPEWTMDRPDSIAVTNDGRTIAVAFRSGIQFVNIDDCGWVGDRPELREQCSLRRVPMERGPYDTYSRMEFNDAGDRLTVYRQDGDSMHRKPIENTQKIVLNPYGIEDDHPDEPKLKYLAMGDSYSSGEGDIDRTANGQSYYLPMTDVDKDNCHISSRSYPFVLRDHYGIFHESMRSIACSGAKVVFDYSRPMAGYMGQGDRLEGKQAIQSAQDMAIENFIPGWVPQLEFVKRYKPEVVTLTGGGNDVGFVDILKYCASLSYEDIVSPWLNSDCGYAHSGSELESLLYADIDTQYKYNKVAIERMRSVSPNTKVVIVGYPRFISEDAAVCGVNGGALSSNERTMIDDAVKYMNSMLSRLAYDTGSSFADVEDSLLGGRICEGSEYVTGVLSWVVGYAGDSEMIHPNARGHQKIAQSIIESNVFVGDSVPGSGSFDPTVDSVITYALDLVQGGVAFVKDIVNISSGAYTFAPGSQYSITIYSTPKDLGTFTADSTGRIDAQLDLSDVQPGHHLIVVRGETVSGEPIHIRQFVEVRYSDTDADGDGILDTEDKCGYIQHWYDERTGKDVCSPAAQHPATSDTIQAATPVPTSQQSDISTAVDPHAEYLGYRDSAYTEAEPILRTGSAKKYSDQYKNPDTISKESQTTMYVLSMIATLIIAAGVIYAIKNKPNSN